MFRGLKGNQGIVESIRLPICLGLLPASTVAHQPKHKFVVTPILICLVSVCLRASVGWRLHPGRSHQRQSKGVLIWLIGTVFAVCENSCPEATCLVGKIDPAMRGYLELTLLSIGSLNRANLPIVSSVLIRSTQRKSRLQV